MSEHSALFLVLVLVNVFCLLLHAKCYIIYNRTNGRKREPQYNSTGKEIHQLKKVLKEAGMSTKIKLGSHSITFEFHYSLCFPVHLKNNCIKIFNCNF
jgi:hypothetical protein